MCSFQSPTDQGPKMNLNSFSVFMCPKPTLLIRHNLPIGARINGLSPATSLACSLSPRDRHSIIKHDGTQFRIISGVFSNVLERETQFTLDQRTRERSANQRWSWWMLQHHRCLLCPIRHERQPVVSCCSVSQNLNLQHCKTIGRTFHDSSSGSDVFWSKKVMNWWCLIITEHLHPGHSTRRFIQRTMVGPFNEPRQYFGDTDCCLRSQYLSHKHARVRSTLHAWHVSACQSSTLFCWGQKMGCIMDRSKTDYWFFLLEPRLLGSSEWYTSGVEWLFNDRQVLITISTHWEPWWPMSWTRLQLQKLPASEFLTVAWSFPPIIIWEHLKTSWSKMCLTDP